MVRYGGEIVSTPDFIYQKNADKVLNRVVLPKKFVEENGRKFYMEVYKDKIILRPIREDK